MPLPLQIINVEGKKYIGIYAKRRIEPGEELNYDYKVRRGAMGLPALAHAGQLQSLPPVSQGAPLCVLARVNAV